MRLSRPCYDKAVRCPGWAGGGTRGVKTYRCDNGHVRTRAGEHPHAASWRFGYCNACDVVTWPSHIRWIDWRWYGWKIRALRRRY